jgi:hypothetical protein
LALLELSMESCSLPFSKEKDKSIFAVFVLSVFKQKALPL